MATDIKLNNTTHDIDISTSSLETFVDNTQVMRQRIKMALLLRAGEWFRDVSVGVPYSEFSKPKNNKSLADSTIISTIRDVDDVLSVNNYESTILPSRILQVSFSAEVAGGQILNLQLEV